MSGWTEFVIADVNEAKLVAEEGNPKRRWPGFEAWKYLGVVELAPLSEILGLKPRTWEDFPHLLYGEDTCVTEVPREIVKALSKISETDIKSSSRSWSDELQRLNISTPLDAVCECLTNLRNLAIQSNSIGKPILFWQSMIG